MKLRKLTSEETAMLCDCGLRPDESGHRPRCPHYTTRRRILCARIARRLRKRLQQEREQ